MAVATYLALQQAILRKTFPAEAEVQNNAGTDPALYEEQLIERAETSTQAALLISQIVYGKVPVDAAKLDSLTAFAQAQFNAYSAKGVARPELGPYEALGLGFSNTPEFAAMLAAAGGSDGQFVTNVYIAAFGVGPTQPQVQHFIDQINYFKGIYTAAGVPAATASLQAHGAVLGQIVGEAATIEGSTLDDLAEGWLRAAADGLEVYNAPIGDSIPDSVSPGELPQTLVLTTGIDVIGPTAEFPLAADDMLLGNGPTIQSNDTVNLGEGFDTAYLVIEPTSLLQLLSVYKLNLISVEQVNVTAGNSINAAIPLQISADNWTGVEQFWLRDSNLGGTAGVIVDDIQENMTLGFDDYQGAAQYRYDNNNNGLGSNATVNVILSDASQVALSTRTDVAGDDIGGLNLDIRDGGNAITLDLQSAGNLDGLSQLFLSGNGNITLNEAEFNTLTVLNGSVHTGDWTIRIPNSTAALAAIGGVGANYLDFNGGFDANDSFNGGDGNDTLETGANTAQFATSANIISVEHLVVTGTLNADRAYTNSAGFTDIVLEGPTTTVANSLQLNGFSAITFNGDDESGLVEVNNTAATTISFGELADFFNGGGGPDAQLDISGVDNATLSYNGTDVVLIEDLRIDTLAAGPFVPAKATDFLAFQGSGDITIDDVIGEIGLVNLSNMSGTIVFNDNFDNGSIGTDFLIGAINGGSQIELDSGTGVSELVMLGGNTGNLDVFGFDITAGTGDVLDFGAMGISSLAELSITFVDDGATDDVVITSNANPGAWSITLQEVGAGPGIVGLVENRIDFDGLVG